MKKKVYLLGIIVIGLTTLSLYSTYAMFTTSVSSDTAINLDTTLNYEFDINSEKTFTLDGNTVLHFNAIVKNNTLGNIKYGIHHNYDLSSGNVQIGEVVEDNTVTTTAGNTIGILNANSNKTIPIAIINNGSEAITVSIGIATGYESNVLTYESGTHLITNTISQDELGELSCESNIVYDEEDCYEENIGGIKYTRCIITIGEEVIPNLDTSGANEPVLADGMIPIYHNGTNWVKADVTNTNSNYQWYDYTNKKWANAVMVSSATRDKYMTDIPGTIIYENDIMAYYVWIPRYQYQLFNVDCSSTSPSLINVSFHTGTSNKATGNINGDWLTHPAFTFGNDELTGFWIGKFELSGSTSSPTIKPNLTSMVNTSLSAQFTTSKIFATADYLTETGINETDSHIIKNIEWGAVTYLKQSQYGIGTTNIGVNNYNSGNSGTNFLTGCGGGADSNPTTTCSAYNTSYGKLASTTGNIHGVYDMSGGAGEYVMAFMKDSAGTSLLYGWSSFTSSTLPFGSKYVDHYANSTSQSNYNIRILGDATCETRGWYSDWSRMAYDNSGHVTVYRGGYADSSFPTYTGIFSFDSSRGMSSWLGGTRVTLAVIK